MTLKLATWNINSVRIRCELIAQYIRDVQPDIICLQETKVENSLFPLETLQALGYPHVVFEGQKSYNGVAILSKIPLTGRRCESYIGKAECRHIAADLPDGTELHNVYIPAGGDIPDVTLNEKFKDKLAFVDSLAAWSGKHITPQRRAIIVGDMNIAPLEHDVWSHKQLLDVVSHTPIEVEKFTAFQKAGNWVDCLRELVPHDQKLYSWWSYRARDWEASNRGRRLDHIWISHALRDTLKGGAIHREARGWNKPSDHVPVMVELAL